MTELEIGDYVLATKYRDGDPKDPWVVGVCAGIHGNRYMVVYKLGKIFRGEGFSRAQKISPKRGEWLLRHGWDIEESGKSLWYWVRAKMTDVQANDTPKHKWVGLTDDEIQDLEDLWERSGKWATFNDAARAIETKLREKNA